MTNSLCHACGSTLDRSFADLGMSPLSNAFIRPGHEHRMEAFFPLHAYVCEKCFLVQLDQFESPERIFDQNYAYFSSYSESWLAHCRSYVEMMISRFGLNEVSQVIEVASNDGYLLQYFKARDVKVLGIEPAANVADVASAKGIPTRVCFFGAKTARELRGESLSADLLLGNNVLAHVPDLNDFVAGVAIALKSDGIATFEFPHLVRLMQENQFDTIYHEHFSYFSFLTVEKIFASHGLQLFDVDELTTHGGSLRIYAQHIGAGQPVAQRVESLREREIALGLDDVNRYSAFAEQIRETKRALLTFLIDAKRKGKVIAGYGAPAKGNTLLNYCGIRQDFIDYTVDLSPHKQGTLLPGTRIPVFAPERIALTKPDYVLILPWNLRDEIMSQMAHIRTWGAKFVVPIPRIEVVG